MFRVGLILAWCLIFFFFYVLPGYQDVIVVHRDISRLEEEMRLKKERSLESYFKRFEDNYWDVEDGGKEFQVKLRLYDEGEGIKHIQTVLQEMDRKLVSFELFYVESFAYITLFFESDQ